MKYTVKHIARVAKRAPSTVRFWADRLQFTDRSAAGYRQFSDEQALQLLRHMPDRSSGKR